MYTFGYRKGIVKPPTATKNADSSLVIVFTTQCLASDSTALGPGRDCLD